VIHSNGKGENRTLERTMMVEEEDDDTVSDLRWFSCYIQNTLFSKKEIIKVGKLFITFLA